MADHAMYRGMLVPLAVLTCQKQKGLGIAAGPLDLPMAPRPGLEPETYGLTEEHPLENSTRKSKICKARFTARLVSKAPTEPLPNLNGRCCGAFLKRRSKSWADSSPEREPNAGQLQEGRWVRG
jgi:hypothetical protein